MKTLNSLFKLFWLLPYSKIRRTKHFQEWFKMPMNYVRIKEFKFVEDRLMKYKNIRTLDISSPKWLAFKLLSDGYSITITDADPYFVDDFIEFKNHFKTSTEIKVFDARNIPFGDESFDQIYSVSVLEHIPDEGDIQVLNEVFRLLKSNGIALITLPASNIYDEEWISKKSFYWKTEFKNDKSFYQRRYDINTIREMISKTNLSLEEIEFIAEKPIKKPYKNSNGMLMHNAYFIKEKQFYKWIKKIDNRLIPFTDFLCELYYSSKYHYSTKDSNDENIRQACLLLRKN